MSPGPLTGGLYCIVHGKLVCTACRMYKMLSLPKRAISVNIDIRMDNGSVGVFNGIRAQHWDARGPFKGGIRYYPNITIDEIAVETFAAVPRQANVQQILKSLCTPSIPLILNAFRYLTHQTLNKIIRDPNACFLHS